MTTKGSLCVSIQNRNGDSRITSPAHMGFGGTKRPDMCHTTSPGVHFLSTQEIQFNFDKEAVWNKVAGRISVVMDTNCWITLADEVDDTACRVRDRLRSLVASGRIFCPLSWGLLEELFKQTGVSLLRTACLMEELSLNTIFIMRTELYQWKLSRSIGRLCGDVAHDSLIGLFAPPAAFVGSTVSLVGDTCNFRGGPEVQEKVKAYMKQKLSKVGIVELAKMMGGVKLNETPPAYSDAARNVREKFKGDKKKTGYAVDSTCHNILWWDDCGSRVWCRDDRHLRQPVKQ